MHLRGFEIYEFLEKKEENNPVG